MEEDIEIEGERDGDTERDREGGRRLRNNLLEKLRGWKLMLSHKMDCLSQRRVVHFAALLLIRFQIL